MTRRPRRALSVATLAWVILASCTCDGTPVQQQSSSQPDVANQGLIVGYNLLADTLEDQSRLKWLKLVRKFVGRGPVPEVKQLMTDIAKASRRRAKELEELRRLAPDVSAKPSKPSPMGDAIRVVAKGVGKQEMLDREGAFNVRFVLLQAQATRMVSVMALAIAEFEPNYERKKWLEETSSEFEGYRDQMIEVILKYVEGKGAAQQ